MIEFGTVDLPEGCRAGTKKRSMLSYIAWKGGVYEDSFRKAFRDWFHQMAEKYPEHFQVYRPRVYPVDEFRWIGPYDDGLTKD